jgi:hypothetical protein
MRRPTKTERAALEHAFANLAAMYAPPPDRAALPALRKAARELQAALAPMIEHRQSPETLQLLAMLQAQAPMGAQAALFDQLTLLQPLLARIVAATESLPDGRGAKPDDEAQAWVLIAADAWVEFTGQLPTAGTGHVTKEHDVPEGADSPFLTALQAFAREHDVPLVTRATLRKALPTWEAFRRA